MIVCTNTTLWYNLQLHDWTNGHQICENNFGARKHVCIMKGIPPEGSLEM